MSDDPARRPGEPDDVDLEFERIVAGLELEQPDDLDDRSGDDGPDTSDELPATSGELFDPRFTDPMSARDYEDAREPDDDDERFEPPDLPAQRIRPLMWLGWAGAVGVPAFMALVAVFGWYVPGGLAAVLVAGFVAGVVYLIMATSRDPDDGDDGAIV